MSILNFIKGIYGGSKKVDDIKKVSEVKSEKSYIKKSLVSKATISEPVKTTSDENFGTSFMTSAATGSVPLGMVVGGSVAGAMLGASLSSTNASSESVVSSRESYNDRGSCDVAESRSSYSSYDGGSSYDSYSSSSSCDSSSSSSSSWD